MNADKFEYILAIAEAQNLTLAAKRLYVSQPGLTQYLNKLEADLGAKLFDRTKSPILLTPAGEYYIQHMKRLMSEEQSINDHVKAISSPNRIFRIGIGQVRGQYWLPTILKSFCAIHPDVNVQTIQKVESDLEDALHKHQLDIAIGTIPFFYADYQIEELLNEKLVLCAHKSFGLIPSHQRNLYSSNNPFIVQAEVLNGLPFIVPSAGNGINEDFKFLCTKYHISASRTIVVSNQQTGFSLAKEGLGVQLLFHSNLSVRDPKVDNDIDYISLDGMHNLRKCVAAYNKNAFNVSLIRDCVRIIKEKIVPQCHGIELIEGPEPPFRA